MRTTAMPKCYRCDAEAVTRAHVPSRSFFPAGYRKNLIAVPSCRDHHTRNHLDVEYVRIFIVAHMAINDSARSLLQDRVIRSLTKSPALFRRVFKNAQPTIVDGRETRMLTYDNARFKLIMSAMAYALYFTSFGKTYSGQWEIFNASSIAAENLFQGRPEGYDELRQHLPPLNLTEVSMPQPEIFRCGFQQWDATRFIYQFVFYGGFMVYALAMPPAYNTG
jgi:hypothetical protein